VLLKFLFTGGNYLFHFFYFVFCFVYYCYELTGNW
jgi:hypothetical protein